MRMRFGSWLGAVAVVGFGASRVSAHELSQWALPLSASVGVGTMENSEMNLKSRTMNALSLEALPSYRVGKWLLGPHFDFRWQGQSTSLEDANGTNLKGSAYLMGFGARYDFNQRFFAQGSIDAIGEYDFAKNTSSDEDDKIISPLSLRVKSGYAFLERIPNLTFDADLQYLTFNKIHIAGSDRTTQTKQIMVAVGITYQFGFGTVTQSKPQPATVEPPAKIEKPLESGTLAAIDEVKKSGDSFVLNLSGNNFEVNSAALSAEAQKKFAKAAETIAQNTQVKVRIEGHTDTSGSAIKNQTLSQARADSVKSFMVDHGVSAERISATGFGSSKPLVDNKTKENRVLNRRVEIYLDSKDGE